MPNHLETPNRNRQILGQSLDQSLCTVRYRMFDGAIGTFDNFKAYTFPCNSVTHCNPLAAERSANTDFIKRPTARSLRSNRIHSNRSRIMLKANDEQCGPFASCSLKSLQIAGLSVLHRISPSTSSRYHHS